MNKLYVLLSYAVCLSSTFAAGKTSSSEFDDCDETIRSGYQEPHTTPQAGPQLGQSTDSPLQLLPAAAQDSVEVPSDVSTTDKTEVDSAVMQEKQPNHSPELRIYLQQRHGRNIEFVLMDIDALTRKYAALCPGEVREFRFVPEVVLQDVARSRIDFTGNISVFDRIGWLANVRGWAKWWLNPFAWWNSSYYSLGAKDTVRWDAETAYPIVEVTTAIDTRYLSSQLRSFLLREWRDKFAPYVAPITQKILEYAVRLRFENVEKPVLESVGFKDVTLVIRVNPVTQRLERCIRVAK